MSAWMSTFFGNSLFVFAKELLPALAEGSLELCDIELLVAIVVKLSKNRAQCSDSDAAFLLQCHAEIKIKLLDSNIKSYSIERHFFFLYA